MFENNLRRTNQNYEFDAGWLYNLCFDCRYNDWWMMYLLCVNKGDREKLSAIKNYLIYHGRRDSVAFIDPFQCPLFHKFYSDEGTLQQHMRWGQFRTGKSYLIISWDTLIPRTNEWWHRCINWKSFAATALGNRLGNLMKWKMER